MTTSTTPLNQTAPHGTRGGIHRLDQITNWLMVAIIAIPFAISAGALTDLAAHNHIAFPLLYPLMVDGGLLIFKALALRSSLHGRRDWYSWGAAASLTAISVLLNVLHVPATAETPWLARFMAALPPLVILTAFIAISRRVEENAHAAGVQHAVQALDKQQAVLSTAVDSLRQEQDKLDKELTDKRTEFRQLVREGQAYLDKLQGQIELAEDKLSRLNPAVSSSLSNGHGHNGATSGHADTSHGQNDAAVAETMSTSLSNGHGHNGVPAGHVDIPRGQSGAAVSGTLSTGRDKVMSLSDADSLNWEAQGDTQDEKIAARRDIVRQLVQQGWDKADIAHALSVSRKTVNRDITSLNGTLSAVAG